MFPRTAERLLMQDTFPRIREVIFMVQLALIYTKVQGLLFSRVSKNRLGLHKPVFHC